MGNIWKVDTREFYYKDGNLILLRDIKIESNFLYPYISAGAGKVIILNSAAGSNQKALTMIKLKDVIIAFPSGCEQAKIGNFFIQFDNTIALHQHKLETIKKMKKTLLKNMFI